MEQLLTPRAALLLAAITVSAVDGDLDSNEVAIINRLDGFSATADWEFAIGVWDDTPMDDCMILVAKSLDQRQKRICFANLVDIALADGSLHKSENTLLSAYAAAFSLDDNEVERIVDVITLKNDKAGFFETEI
ncbi:MAG: TerB family tellurite resistance protein [Gammaproteobacteria bacterium]|nr:TerB family tellurite resistance protein [Gammaproteobacteria bacterium]